MGTMTVRQYQEALQSVRTAGAKLVSGHRTRDAFRPPTSG